MKKIRFLFSMVFLSALCAVFCVTYAAAEGETNHNKSFWREHTGENYTLEIDATQRGSVWKSNGRIEIVDGNDTIAFDPEDLKTIGEELRAINDDNIAQKKALARTMIEMATQLNQTIDHYGGNSDCKIDISGIDANNPDISALEDVSEQLSNYYANYHNIISSEIDALKKSVADAKSAIASAVTNKGVSTSSDASFDTIITNINKISTGYKGQSINNIGYKDITYKAKDKSGSSYVGHGRMDYSLTVNDKYDVIIFSIENDRGTVGTNYDAVSIASVTGAYRVLYQVNNGFYVCALVAPAPGTTIRFVIDFSQSSAVEQDNCVGRLRIWGLK